MQVLLISPLSEIDGKDSEMDLIEEFNEKYPVGTVFQVVPLKDIDNDAAFAIRTTDWIEAKAFPIYSWETYHFKELEGGVPMD